MVKLNILNSQDLFHQINERRSKVEPYLPIESAALAALHLPGIQPRVWEFISSQAEYQPSGGYEEAFFALADQNVPHHIEYAQYAASSKADVALQKVMKAAENVSCETLIQRFLQEKKPDPNLGGIEDLISFYLQSREMLAPEGRDMLKAMQLPSSSKEGVTDEAAVNAIHETLLKVIQRSGGRPEDFELVMELDKLNNTKHQIFKKLFEHFYPEEFKILTAHDQKTKTLQEAMIKERSKEIGFEPPALLEEVKKHLKETLQIHDVESGHLNLFNGGSYVTLALGVGAVIKPGQYLVTPELHWDGYNSLPERYGGSLLDVPRAEKLEAFLLKKLKVNAADGEKCENEVRKKIGCILLTHPCSITGKRESDETLGEYLAFSKKYKIPLIVNEVYAGPDHMGTDYNSITNHPDFNQASDLVYISSSLTKTFQQLNVGGPKLAFCWTKNKEWADKVQGAIAHHNHPFTTEEATYDMAFLRGTPKQYFVDNEKTSEERRTLIENAFEKFNTHFQKKLLSWPPTGRPKAGHTVAIQINSDIVAKAGIKSPMDLWEYVYKVAGVNAGPVFFSPDQEASKNHPPMALRFNYSVSPEYLENGLELLAFAVMQMEHGVTFDMIKDKHGKARNEFDNANLVQRMMAEYGSDEPAKDVASGR